MLKNCAFAIISSALIFFAVTIPFSGGRSPLWAIGVYTDTANSYPLASLGAFNFFGIFGGIGTGMGEKFMFLTFDKWSKIFLAAAPAVGGITYFFIKDKSRSLISALITYTTIYTFVGMMHERYLYPSLIMLVFSFILTENKCYLSLYSLFSLVNYACVARSMFAIYIGQNTDKSPPSYVFSTLMVVGYFFLIRVVKQQAESKSM